MRESHQTEIMLIENWLLPLRVNFSFESPNETMKAVINICLLQKFDYA